MDKVFVDDGVFELSENEISAVGGAGFFEWLGNVLDNTVINIFGWEVSDGNPNT